MEALLGSSCLAGSGLFLSAKPHLKSTFPRGGAHLTPTHWAGSRPSTVISRSLGNAGHQKLFRAAARTDMPELRAGPKPQGQKNSSVPPTTSSSSSSASSVLQSLCQEAGSQTATRRALIGRSSLGALGIALAASTAPGCLSGVARAEGEAAGEAVGEMGPGLSSLAVDPPATNNYESAPVYFDVAIDREPVGRIVIGLYGKDVPLGAARFAELARGKEGISYRRKEFVKINANNVINAGLRSFSLTGGARDTVSVAGGETGEKVLEELTALAKRPQGALKNARGTVSLVCYDPTIPPPKSKLVAKDGKLINVEEAAARTQPNGTEFAVNFADAPEMDGVSSVVGRVLEGLDVVARIAAVPAVRENTNSPYFKAAKAIGDPRAVVAERGFNRPFLKVVITKSGELE
eukprot:jgi/Mesen1/8471/ME000478S07963